MRVGIAGATGYSGGELVRLLVRHPEAELTVLMGSADRTGAQPSEACFPQVTGLTLPQVEPLDVRRLCAGSDVVFLALPHGVGARFVPELLEAGSVVIDLSGDYRLTDPAGYETWYGWSHPAPALLGEAVYGLTEWARTPLGGARLVANPGCYATGVLLALLPLLEAGLVRGDVVADGKSGLSGAGRKLDASLLFAEVHDNVWPYKFGSHHHLAEMRQQCAAVSSAPVRLTFTPQVVPLHRGLLSTMYVWPEHGRGAEEIQACWRDRYDGEPFLRVHPVGSLPALRDAVATNRCDLGCAADPQTDAVLLVSGIDNLTKGAAGQAIQNMNVRFGWPETTGLVP